jgi:hypothetical protein
LEGLGSSQSRSSSKRRGRSTPLAKRTPNIRHLALGLMISMDHVTANAKPKPISPRNATRSRVANYVQTSLPQQRRYLYPSSDSLRSGRAQVQRHCFSSWGEFVL